MCKYSADLFQLPSLFIISVPFFFSKILWVYGPDNKDLARGLKKLLSLSLFDCWSSCSTLLACVALHASVVLGAVFAYAAAVFSKFEHITHNH